MHWKPCSFNPGAVVRSLVMNVDGKNEVALSPSDYMGRFL